MTFYLIKTILSAILIVLISEIAKASSWVAAFITSLPIMSILALTWLYIDTQNIDKVSDLSMGIFWMVIPSLIFFVALSYGLKQNLSFWLSLAIASTLTASTYALYVLLLKKIGITL